MGIMTDIAMNYVVNPLSEFWKRLDRGMQRIGYARAAAELRRQGYGDLANKLMKQRETV